MIKIFLKAAVLVLIILSIYFIVHPAACGNLLAGRITNPADTNPAVQTPAGDHGNVLSPAGDKPLRHMESAPEKQDAVKGVVDTNTLQDEEFVPAKYTQQDMDMAIAMRYVELEREYSNDKEMSKEGAKEIAYIVMDEFELTPEEWDSFLQRATADNLFDRVRAE